MVRNGIAEPTAQGPATTVLAAIEGGILLSRAAGNAVALRSVATSLHQLIDAAAARQ